MLQALEKRPFLLCVAQHRRNKNIELLLKGFAAMLAKGIVGKDMRLLIVGSTGPETPTIVKAIATLELKAHVILAHGVTDAELAWLYKNTLLSVSTSTVEGFGLPLIEAVQYGSPAVCSDIPAFREIGGDSCVFFSLCAPDPVANLVRACEYALRQSTRPVADTARFSANVIGAQWMDIYSELLQAKLANAA